MSRAVEALGSRVGNQDQRLEQALAGLGAAFHRLVLVCGGPNSGKTRALSSLAQRFGAPTVNLNLVLTQHLLEINVRKRSLQVANIVANVLEGPEDVLILDNTEILFDRTMALDPLRVLQGLSRNRTVVASWAGGVSEGRLVYAVPGHPEFRSYREVDAVIIDLAERGLTEE